MRIFSPFVTLCNVGFFSRLSYGLARTPVLPLFALSLGASPEAIGFVVGASTITGIFFKLPSGALSDIIGRKTTLLAGLLVFALTPFAYVFVDSYSQLVTIRFVHGLATAVYGPVSMAIVIDIAGNQKGEKLALFSSVTIIGNLIAAPLGGYLLYAIAKNQPTLSDFHSVYLISGLSGIIAFLLSFRFFFGLRATTRETKGSLRGLLQRFWQGIKEVISDKRVIVTSNMEGIQNLSVGALEAFLPVYVVKIAGLSVFHAGFIWGVQIGITILAKPVMGRISDRYGRKPLVTSGLILCAVSLFIIPLTISFWILLVLALLFGLGEAFVTSSTAALVADICKKQHYGSAMGTFGTIYDIGHASGPILAGILIAAMNYASAFAIIGGLLTTAAVFFVLTDRESLTV
jgi:MFS family permease